MHVTKQHVFVIFILVVALFVYTNSLPVVPGAEPSPPTATIEPTTVPSQSTESETDMSQTSAISNVPMNESLAVKGDVWVTPTPGPVPSDFAFLKNLGIASEKYADLPNSTTLPVSVWQAWPCTVKGSWPATHSVYCPLISYFAQGLNNGVGDVNQEVLMAFTMTECPTGKPDCQNQTSGATGLCQVMPSDDERSLSVKNASGVSYFAGRPTVAQLKDPVFNLAFCARLAAGYVLAQGGDTREGFKNLGHVFPDDPYKEARMLQEKVIKYAGYDPFPQ